MAQASSGPTEAASLVFTSPGRGALRKTMRDRWIMTRPGELQEPMTEIAMANAFLTEISCGRLGRVCRGVTPFVEVFGLVGPMRRGDDAPTPGASLIPGGR